MFRLMKSSSPAVPGAWLLVFVWCLLAASASPPASHPAASEENKIRLRAQQETPDDPPGEAARPLPGAVKALPVRLGAFTSIQVNVGPGGVNIVGDAANETSIAVDPTAPNRMAIGWRQFDTVTSNFREAGYAYSIDGGRTWTFPGVLEEGVFRSDPVLDFNSQGTFYYTSLRVVGGVYYCDVYKSKTGGIAWYPYVRAFGGDKQWTAVDRTGGIGHGNFYETWSIAGSCCGDSIFTRSIDDAQTFMYPVYVPSTPIWGTMDVAPNGNLYIAGIEMGITSSFVVIKSTNAKDPMATPTFNPAVGVNMAGSVQAFIVPSPNPGGLLGQVNIAVNPTNGHVYMLTSVKPLTADPMDVHFARSTDGGQTWSSVIRVNDDSLINGAWQWFATMSVAPNGRIDVIWNDTRNSGLTNISRLYYTSSTNGGSTWAASQPVSPPWNSHIGWPNQNKIGDYYDMVSDDVGAHVAWAATFNGEQDAYYLRIGDYDCNANGVGDLLDIAHGTSSDDNSNGIPDECDDLLTGVGGGAASGKMTAYRLYQNTPNPFNPSTAIRFDVPVGGGHVRLAIFDVTGRRIRTLVDNYEPAGARTVTWNGRNREGIAVASGLYFYRLSAPGFTETRKLVLIK
ncbi:MAG: FlgD immunoglobulin-like domain containing protein [Candidatus Latescibacterota bacterium]